MTGTEVRECHGVQVDGGGTKIQVSVRLVPGGDLIDVLTFEAKDYPVTNTKPGSGMGSDEGLSKIAAEYVARTGWRPRNGSVVIAGPVDQDSDEHIIPNGPWKDIIIQKSHVRRAFGITEELSWNVDMVGWACSIGGLRPDDVAWIGGGSALASDESGVSQVLQHGGTAGVSAMGTGLGQIGIEMILLTQRRLDAALRGSHSLVLPGGKMLIPNLRPGESGHCTAAHLTPYAGQVYELVAEEFGGHCSTERLASGLGIFNAYRAVCHLGVPHLGLRAKQPELPKQEDVTAGAFAPQPDPYCEATLDVVSEIYGVGVGNFILAHGIEEMFLPGLAWLLHNRWHKGLRPFLDACVSKGRFGQYVGSTRFYVMKPRKSGVTYASIGAAVAQEWGF